MTTTEETLDGYADGAQDDNLADLTREERIKAAIRDGKRRSHEMADYTECARRTTRDTANEMAENGELVRDRDGDGYYFELPEGQPQMADDGGDGDEQELATARTHDRDFSTGDAGDDAMPVTRDYDWDDWMLEDHEVHEYIPTDGELDDIRSLIDTRHETGFLPHVSLSGPSGTAKTGLGRNIAHDLGAPMFTIQCGDGLRVADLLGSPQFVENETRWADGTATKALLASQEREVVVLLDEVNRAPPRALGILFSMMDDRCQLTLDGRGGEVVKGDPMNLIVISTMNKGPAYMTNRIDAAQKRRLGPEWQIDHLGLVEKEREVELVADRTPVGYELASRLVETANVIREKAASTDTPAIQFGVSTALVLEWARMSYGLKHADNPVVRAANRAFVNPFYSDSDDAENLVTEILNKFLDGCPVEDADVKQWAGDADTPGAVSGRYECKACGWFEDSENVDPMVAADHECPDCGATLQLHEDDN